MVTVALIIYFSMIYIVIRAPLHKLDKKRAGSIYDEDNNQKIVIPF